ncbi:MAG: porin [Negativicutes bacterium]|nr:porin [Negativicutes bacterium]
MKKRLLTAAVLASLTLSTAVAFAAPTFSGDANIEYRNQDGSGDYLTNRIRLNVDADIDGTFYIHGRAKMNNDLRNTTNGGNVSFDQAYIGAKVGASDVRVGRQSLAIGKGLLMDDDNFIGAQVTTKAIEGLSLAGFYGKDNSSASVETTFVDMGTSFSGVNVGASYLKSGDKYYAVNADTKLTENVVLNVEYAKNTTDKADGFLAEVAVGQAAKKGDFAYKVSYRDIEANALPDFTTDGWYKNSKGFRVKGIYKVSDKATLTAYQDIAETQAGADHNRTNVEFSVNF